jgi:diaminopimelate decarboxylase
MDGPELPLSDQTPVAASDDLVAVLESAARLQRLVPDAVLVGGSAAAAYAGHRDSFDHDHVLADLRDRFDTVLEALESEDGWVTNRLVPGKLILGRLGDIETGIRQLIRTAPLETARMAVPSGGTVVVPTMAETLRVKAFLIVRRNQTRDYLDVAALSDRFGLAESAAVLARLDDYYADQHQGGDGVASQLLRQLADPKPGDPAASRELAHYKNLRGRWRDWGAVVRQCSDLALATLRIRGG